MTRSLQKGMAGSSNNHLPRHVAIIPDGNRRWARGQGLNISKGHERGVEIFRDVAKLAAKRNIEHLSLWGMSLDNLMKRSPREVTALLNIFRREFLRLATDRELQDRQTRINVLGRWREKFPLPVKRAIRQAVSATSNYSRYYLNFLLVYNGTDEMLQAVRDLSIDKINRPSMKISGRSLQKKLWTGLLPPVDLIIRTAGDPHMSNGFMMWQAADAELYFSNLLWPDFSSDEFDKALESYSRRRRLRGK
jgi:undecaprenyl diphosphate synthase